MILPEEFKNTGFSQSFMGYNKTEVDARITKLASTYTELAVKYDALTEKLHSLEVTLSQNEKELSELRENEDAIRKALVNSQNAAAKIIDAAKVKSGEIEELTREKCAEVIAEFREHIRAERERLSALRAQATEFKKRLYEQYQEHISSLESTTASVYEPDWDMTSADATRNVLLMLRGEVERRTRNDELEEEKLDSELGTVIDDISKAKEKENAEGEE